MEIKGKELVVDKIGCWFPMSVSIVALQFVAEESYNQAATLDLSLVPNKKQNVIIRLKFTGVQNIKLQHPFAPNGIDCSLFEILSIKNDQLENLNWLIGEFKTDNITFYAKTVEVASVL